MELRVLNLRRTPERWAAFRTHNPSLDNAQQVEAVDGQALDLAALIAEGIVAADLNYRMGALGNALSHIAEWQRILHTGEPATILEDDAVLCGNFAEEAGRILKNLPQDWDLMQWGYNFDTLVAFEVLDGSSVCYATFDQTRMRAALPSFHRQAVVSQSFRLCLSLGIPAYAVSPKGAARLLAFCLPLRRTQQYYPLLGRIFDNESIDFMLNSFHATASSHVAMPALALTANNSAVSTVQEGKELVGRLLSV